MSEKKHAKAPEKNTYTQAADAYGVTDMSTADQRTLEARALLKSAQRIEGISERLRAGEKIPHQEIFEILQVNQKLWILFVDGSVDEKHPLPQEIKNNILSLAVFIFGQTRDMMLEPTEDGMRILISINRKIAAGLSKRVESKSAAPEAPGEASRKKITDSVA